MLSPPQQIALRYHEDLKRRVERSHAEQLVVRRLVTHRAFHWPHCSLEIYLGEYLLQI